MSGCDSITMASRSFCPTGTMIILSGPTLLTTGTIGTIGAAYPLARIVRRSQIGELVQRIAMRSDFVSRYLSVGVYRAEHVEHVVGECPAILRKGCGSARVIGKNVRQQRFRHGDCIVRSVATRVFQFMGEGTHELIIVGRIPLEVQLPCLSGKENRWFGTCAPIGLNPAVCSLVEGAAPQSHFVAPKSRVGQFEHDAANILVREEIVAGELHIVEQAIGVEEERIAAPTEESPVVAGFRHQRLPSDGHRYSLDDDVAFVAYPSRSRALNTAKCRSLLSIFGGRELGTVGDIRNGIAICVDLDFIQCARREGLFRRRAERADTEGGVYVQDQD